MFNNFYKRTTTKQSLIVLKRRCYLWLFTSSVHTNLHTRLQTQTTITAFTCSAHAEPRLFKRTPCCEHTEMPCFSQAGFTPLRFYKRPTSVPVFANNQKVRRRFLLLRIKVETLSPLILQWAEAARAGSKEGGPAKLLPGPGDHHPAPQHHPPEPALCLRAFELFLDHVCIR